MMTSRPIRLTLKMNDAKKSLRASLKKSVSTIIGFFVMSSIFIQLVIANTRIQIAMQYLSYHQLGGSKTHLCVLNCGNSFR